MLDIRVIRNDTGGVRAALARRAADGLLDEVLALDERRRALQTEVDELRARIRASIVEQLCRLLAPDRERGHLGGGRELEITAIALTAMVEEFAGRWFALGRTLGTTEIDQLTALCAGALYGGEAAAAEGQKRLGEW